jgi:hypothetical protein
MRASDDKLSLVASGQLAEVKGTGGSNKRYFSIIFKAKPGPTYFDATVEFDPSIPSQELSGNDPETDRISLHVQVRRPERENRTVSLQREGSPVRRGIALYSFDIDKKVVKAISSRLC